MCLDYHIKIISM